MHINRWPLFLTNFTRTWLKQPKTEMWQGFTACWQYQILTWSCKMRLVLFVNYAQSMYCFCVFLFLQSNYSVTSEQYLIGCYRMDGRPSIKHVGKATWKLWMRYCRLELMWICEIMWVLGWWLCTVAAVSVPVDFWGTITILTCVTILQLLAIL